MRRAERIVGVYELRAHPSAYLCAVSRGDSVTMVTDARPVARLVPVKRTPNTEALERLVASGGLQRGVSKRGTEPRVRVSPS